MAGYLPFDEPNIMALYKKIWKAEFVIPSWVSSAAKKLLKRILDANPHILSPLQKIPMQRSVQAPRMMRHGPYPGGLGTAVHHRSLESPEQLLEKKLADQAAEMDRLLRENQRLAVTHVALRKDLGATQQEMQRINVHCRSVQTESDIQIRGLLEKIGKMEADIAAGEMLTQELQQVHLEAQSLINARLELTAEIQHVTNELQKADDDTRRLPQMHSELDALRQEHQKLR